MSSHSIFPQSWPAWYYDEEQQWSHQLYRVHDHYQLDSPRSHFLSSPSPDFFPDSDDQPRDIDYDSQSRSSPSVKEEPDDPAACFIMELSAPQASSSLLSQSLAPPTEVPLRATQASSDMRRMMTVFRLNPFAIHNAAGSVVPAPFESARALDAEPITFEFQLDIEPGILDPEAGGPDALDNPVLRSFSPDFDLHDKVPAEPWHQQSWDISYPDAEDNFSSISVSSGYHHHPMSSPRRSSRFHNSVSPTPYIHHQKAATLVQDDSYSTTSSSSPGAGVHYHTTTHRIVSPQPEPINWGQPSSLRDVGYHTAAASRSTNIPYADSSIRRWSLPDPHASTHFLV